jgi:tetratricopeptide (TPR) repeat protein
LPDRINDIDQVIKEAIHYCPNAANLYYTYANALGKAGPSRYGDSEKAFVKALKLDPNNANFYANLGTETKKRTGY